MTTNPYSDPFADSFVYSGPSKNLEYRRSRNTKAPWEMLLAVLMVFTGSIVFFGGAYVMLFKDPRSNYEDLIGLAGWCFGSTILGFGLAFLRFGWITSTVIGILSPGLTIAFAVFLFWLPALMSGLLNGSR